MYLDQEHLHGLTGEIVRALLFAAEGVFLSFGSLRLHSALRKAAESDAWHRRLVQTTSEGIVVTDEHGTITYANPGIGQILQIAPERLKGRTMEEFFFPADLSVERVRLGNRLTGSKQQFDRRLRRLDGSEAWVLTCASPLDSSDASSGVLAMMTDITERKNAEHALRRSEERYRGLFDNILQGVYQSTPDGRILAANPMLLRMLGLSNETEMNDVDIAQQLYADPRVRPRLLERLDREGSFQNVEYQLRRRDGKIISVQENARVVRDEHGAVLYYEGTLTDITVRKRLDSRLLQSQKMEALSRLSGGIAHDFGNVLTVIAGYSQLILEELPVSHPARLNAQMLIASVESAGELIDQLHSFGAPGGNLRELLDLNEVVRHLEPEILTFVNDNRARERRTGGPVELGLFLCPEPLHIQADPGHLRQVMLSLIARCRDNIGDSKFLNITTDSVRQSNSGTYAALSVGCNALSLPASVSPDAELAHGFGLATTEAIVAQYDGSILMHSSPDSNVVLTFVLPLHRDLSDPVNEPQPALREAAPQPTILLVDDEPLVREISRDMLERRGYRVLVVPGAPEAERVCQDGTLFDLLITDVFMPQITGPELARRLRARNPGLKVLFISGYSDAEVPDSGLASTDALLQKPYSADSLESRIREILDRP